MMKFLNFWPIFVIIHCTRFNSGMNNQNSSKGRPWLDLNLLPHELQEPLDESLNPNLTDESEPLNKSVNHDQYFLQKPPDNSAVFKTKYLTIPRVDAKGKTLSQDDLEILFLETKGRQWKALYPHSTYEEVIKERQKKFCSNLWNLLEGPKPLTCYSVPIDKTVDTSHINLVTQYQSYVEVDTLCCTCLIAIRLRESFIVSQYSTTTYFILHRTTRSSRLQVAGIVYNVKDYLHYP